MSESFKAGDTVALNEHFWRAFGSLYQDWRGLLRVEREYMGRFVLAQAGRDPLDTLELVPAHHMTLVRRADDEPEWAEAGAPAPC